MTYPKIDSLQSQNPYMQYMNNINQFNYNPYTVGYYSPVMFRGADSNIVLKTQPDTVEFSAENQIKKKKSNRGLKIAGAITGAIGTLVLSMYLISKHQTAKIEKLYKEKLIPQTFKEKLNFKKAATIEEARNYAEKVLGIKDIDKDFSLEGLNYANQGITDVINKNIGKEVFVTRRLVWKVPQKNESWIAYAESDIKSDRFGEIGINKNYFDDKFLTEKLSKLFPANKNKDTAADTAKDAANEFGLHYKHYGDNETVNLIDRFKANPSSLSLEEKRTLYYTYKDSSSINLSKRTDLVKILEDNNSKLGLNVEDFKKLSHDEQFEKLNNALKEKGLRVEAPLVHTKDDGLTTMYHEMGHLQDYAKNLKNCNISFWKSLNPFSKVNTNEPLDAYGNHWGGITYDGYKELLKNNPKRFEKLYPDLYKHLTDKEIQKTTGKVSWYAQTSIGEFIAEVYQDMISGKTIPDDVMALYKKYNGPLLP